MVKVKLKETYINDFLTTTSGEVFYRKNNSLGKDESVKEISLDVKENEVLVSQGILVLASKKADEENQKKADEEKQKKADEEKQKKADEEKQKKANEEKQKKADEEKMKKEISKPITTIKENKPKNVIDNKLDTKDRDADDIKNN